MVVGAPLMILQSPWLGEIKIKQKQRERKIKEELVRCTQYLMPSSVTL